MLVRLPIFASLATLAVADFRVYWLTRQSDNYSFGTNEYGGVKLSTNQPTCAGLLEEKDKNLIPVAANLGHATDVSDSAGGGYMCDGCPSDKDWAEWRPDRIQMNGKGVFRGAPEAHYITLYRNNDGSYTVKDTKDAVQGTCSLVAQNKNLLDCGGGFAILEAFNCKTPDITV